MEKIHEPDQGISIFALYGGGLSRDDGLDPRGRNPGGPADGARPEQSSGGPGRGGPARRYLVLRAGRKDPLLFLSAHRPPAGAQPPAPVMRLRKHLSGRHITRVLAHWTDRRLYLETSGGVTLLLDLREGPRLLFEPAPAFAEPVWPEAADSASALCEGDLWRDRPVLTPALRRVLPRLEPEEARALLMDLRAGGGDVFVYENPAGERRLSAWPLPRARDEGWSGSVWENPLPALALAGEQVYAALAARARQAAARPFAAEVRRLDALLDKLNAEEARLGAMRDRQADALLLQANLYRLDRDKKSASLTLDGPEGPRGLSLDPRLSARENMAALFHQAARGRRGLEHLARRREAVLAEREAALNELARREAAATGSPAVADANAARRPGGNGRDKRNGRSSALPAEVQLFRSGDGFAILRGRNTRGNALALRLAAPHDYWLHTADCPGAHVIIRRDHAGHVVPERTLLEAGALAALKSPLRDAARAEIQYSLAKYIHPMKHAGPGMVRIDRSEGSFGVSPDPGLEERLAPPASWRDVKNSRDG